MEKTLNAQIYAKGGDVALREGEEIDFGCVDENSTGSA